MESYVNYNELIKPSWSPPAWLFGPVWSILYLVIAYSFGSVFLKVIRGELPVTVRKLVDNFGFFIKINLVNS
jgi:tryptophan-rich sensory protein